MILLEGMDPSGKSTLGDELLRYLNDNGGNGYSMIHSGGPEKYPGEIIERIRTLPRSGKFILDRHPLISQHVYARTDRDPPPTTFTAGQVADWVHGLPALPTIVWCCGRAPHVMKPGESEDHAQFLEDKWQALNLKYAELFGWFNHASIPFIAYDFAVPHRDRVVKAILDQELS